VRTWNLPDVGEDLDRFGEESLNNNPLNGTRPYKGMNPRVPSPSLVPQFVEGDRGYCSNNYWKKVRRIRLGATDKIHTLTR